MNTEVLQVKNPWSALIGLLAIVFCSILLTQLPVILGSYLLSEAPIVDLNSNVAALKNPWMTYLLMASSNVGAFLIPAYVFQRFNPDTVLFPAEQFKNWKLYALSLLFMLLAGPLLTLVSDWNMQMKLPAQLAGIEGWMRDQEDNMAGLTQQMLMVEDYPSLVVNLLVIAILPAIGEEFFFRGVLQNIFTRVFKGAHASIWLVAIIFSAIHIQFFGFFPRLLLGLFFGYMLLWSNNIWIPVLAHLVNNATVVLVAFVYTRQGKSYAALMESDSYTFIVYLGSLILSVSAAYLFYRYATKKVDYGKKLD